MRISSLRYFYEVAELKSISKVSTNLHISQPALSHQLFKLEKDLGVKLLERSNRGVNLTSKGEILYNYAKKILVLHDSLIEDIKIDNYVQKELKINIYNIYSNFIMKSISKSLLNNFKGFNISINNQQTSNEKALLLNDRSHIMIGFNKIDDSDLISNCIGQDKIICVSNKKITKDKLKKVPVAILNDTLNISPKLNYNLQNINIGLKTDSLDVIKGYLKNSDVAAIVPKLAVQEELESKNLINLELEEFELNYDLYMTYKKDINTNLKKKIKVLNSELEYALNEKKITVAI